MKPIAPALIAAAALATASNALAVSIQMTDVAMANFVGDNENFTWSANAVTGPISLNLDVGDVRTFTYGRFSTNDFALNARDLADNNDAFGVSWILSGAQVSAIGTPDALSTSRRSAHGLMIQAQGQGDGGKDKGHGGKGDDRGDKGKGGKGKGHGGKNKGEAKVDFDNSWIDVMFGNGGLYQVKFLDSDTLTHDGTVKLKAKVRLVRDSSPTPPTPVPEPAGLALVAVALLGIALARRRTG